MRRGASSCDSASAKRATLAKENGVPAYIIFHDSVLRSFAADRPGTLSQMGEIQGVGAKKLETWGGAFLEVVREYEGA